MNINLKTVNYIGLEIDDTLKLILKNIANKFINDNKLNGEYRFLCHHMTIAFKTSFDESVQNWINSHIHQKYQLDGYEIGFSDKAIALKVKTTCPSKNELKHITLAVNVGNGGKPVDSNKITNWQPINPITLEGTVECF